MLYDIHDKGNLFFGYTMCNVDYNVVMIAWVDKEDLKVEIRFYVYDYFPSKNTGVPCRFDVAYNCEFEKVKLATEKRFLKFLKRII